MKIDRSVFVQQSCGIHFPNHSVVSTTFLNLNNYLRLMCSLNVIICKMFFKFSLFFVSFVLCFPLILLLSSSVIICHFCLSLNIVCASPFLNFLNIFNVTLSHTLLFITEELLKT